MEYSDSHEGGWEDVHVDPQAKYRYLIPFDGSHDQSLQVHHEVERYRREIMTRCC